MSTKIHLRDTLSQLDSRPRVKPAPQISSIPVPFSYIPSDDGTDENLLILLHGLGDTNIPFADLGRSLKLPQTATLALRAPEQQVDLVFESILPHLICYPRIPFLYEAAFQWYTSFSLLGELITQPNPTSAIDLLMTTLRHLQSYCTWPPDRIHLFGFAQGGSVASEFGVSWWKMEMERLAKSLGNGEVESSTSSSRPLGSIVTIEGPLLEYPSAPSQPNPTHVLAFYHSRQEADKVTPSFRKAFEVANVVVHQGKEGMPRSKDEWMPIMTFWSKHLGRRHLDGLYEVMTGGPS